MDVSVKPHNYRMHRIGHNAGLPVMQALGLHGKKKGNMRLT